MVTSVKGWKCTLRMDQGHYWGGTCKSDIQLKAKGEDWWILEVEFGGGALAGLFSICAEHREFEAVLEFREHPELKPAMTVPIVGYSQKASYPSGMWTVDAQLCFRERT